MYNIRLLTLKEYYKSPIMKYIGEKPLYPSGNYPRGEWLMTAIGWPVMLPCVAFSNGEIGAQPVHYKLGIRPVFECDSIESIIGNGYSVTQLEANIWNISGRYVPIPEKISKQEQNELLQQLNKEHLRRTRMQHYYNVTTGRNMDEYEDDKGNKYAVNRNGIGEVLSIEKCKQADIYALKTENNTIMCVFKEVYWELPFDKKEIDYSSEQYFSKTDIYNSLNYP